MASAVGARYNPPPPASLRGRAVTGPGAERRAAMQKVHPALGLIVLISASVAVGGENEPPEGFVPLFNGRDLAGWKVPEGDGGHWKVVDGVIDYDAESQARGDRSLWT